MNTWVKTNNNCNSPWFVSSLGMRSWTPLAGPCASAEVAVPLHGPSKWKAPWPCGWQISSSRTFAGDFRGVLGDDVGAMVKIC